MNTNESTTAQTTSVVTDVKKIIENERAAIKEATEMLAHSTPTQYSVRECLTNDEIAQVVKALRINSDELSNFIYTIKDLLNDEVEITQDYMSGHRWSVFIRSFAVGDCPTFSTYACTCMIRDWLEELAENFENIYYKIFCKNFSMYTLKDKFMYHIVCDIERFTINRRTKIPY